MPTNAHTLRVCLLQGGSKSGRETKLQELDVVSEGVTCITEHEGFHPVCLDQWVLQTAAFQTRPQYGQEAVSGPPHRWVLNVN